MTRVSERGAVTRTILYIVVVIVLIVAVVGLWVIMGPGPMDFAGGKRAALTTSTSGPGPAGVPAELANASLIERGQ